MAGIPFSFKDLNKNPKGSGTVGGIIIEPQPEPELRDPIVGLANAHSVVGTAPTDREWRSYAELWTEGYFTKEWQEKFDDNFTDRNHFRRVIEPVLADLATRAIRAKEAARIQTEQTARNVEISTRDKVKLLCCGTYADPQRLSFDHERRFFYLPCSRCGTRNKIELKVVK